MITQGCEVKWNGEYGFEIMEGKYKHIVDINLKVCICRNWMLKGIPCPHVICAMYELHLEPEEYIGALV